MLKMGEPREVKEVGIIVKTRVNQNRYLLARSYTQNKGIAIFLISKSCFLEENEN